MLFSLDAISVFLMVFSRALYMFRWTVESFGKPHVIKGTCYSEQKHTTTEQLCFCCDRWIRLLKTSQFELKVLKGDASEMCLKRECEINFEVFNLSQLWVCQWAKQNIGSFLSAADSGPVGGDNVFCLKRHRKHFQWCKVSVFALNLHLWYSKLWQLPDLSVFVRMM